MGRISQGHRHLTGRPFVRAGVAISASALMLGLGTCLPASASGAKGSSGSFTFGGVVSGTLKVPDTVEPGGLTACSISPSQGGTDVITWNGAKLKDGGTTKKIPDIELQIEVSTFGKTYGMAPDSNGTTSGTVFFSDNSPYQWTAQSGTITTAPNGTSGTVEGVLAVPSRHEGSISIKGTWAGCTKLAD